MAWSIENYLRDALAARLLRETWGGGPVLSLAQEVVAWISGIQRPVQKVTTVDEDGNPFVVPTIQLPTVDLGDFDLDQPESPAIPPPVITTPTQPPTQDPEHDGPPTGDQPQEITQSVVQRNSFPAKVVSRSGLQFSVLLYRNSIDSPPVTVTATCCEEALADTVYVNQWVSVWMYAQYKITVQTSNGISNGDLQPENVKYSFIPPGNSGKATTTSEISARGGSTDGSGTGTLDSGLGTGSSVTLYNTVSTTVASGRYVQWKMIDGKKVIDVEDCAG